MANLASLFNNQPFKPNDVEELDFSPVPKGDYVILITESEIGMTKNGQGTLLTLKLVVQDGKYKGRTVFENLCVQHSNEIAQRIAQIRLKQICDAVGVGQLVDSNQIHDKPLIAQIDMELDQYAMDKRGDGEKVYRNVIKGYGPVTMDNKPQQATTKKPKAPAVAETVGEGYSEDIPF